jgi:hypothetical protein
MIEQEEDPTNEYLDIGCGHDDDIDLPLDDVDEEEDEFDIDEFEE